MEERSFRIAKALVIAMNSFAALTLMAPAKLNLSLDITSRREDGYHELETVMQTVDICDRVTVSLSMENGGGIFLRCPGFPELEGDGNIACKAARAFFKAANINIDMLRVDILIRKHIPFGAGMGGGSADGAAVLVGLNRLCNTSFTIQRLCEIGVLVGADIPFCIMGGTALAKGIGEILTPLSPFPDCRFVVVKPSVSISTAAAYMAADNGGIKKRPQTLKLLEAIKKGDIKNAANSFSNVFEQVTPPVQYTEISKAKSVLSAYGAINPTMTGSGSAVFGLFPDIQGANDCYFSLCDEGMKGVYICEPVKSGPWFCDEVDILFEE